MDPNKMDNIVPWIKFIVVIIVFVLVITKNVFTIKVLSMVKDLLKNQ